MLSREFKSEILAVGQIKQEPFRTGERVRSHGRPQQSVVVKRRAKLNL